MKLTSLSPPSQVPWCARQDVHTPLPLSVFYRGLTRLLTAQNYSLCKFFCLSYPPAWTTTTSTDLLCFIHPKYTSLCIPNTGDIMDRLLGAANVWRCCEFSNFCTLLRLLHTREGEDVVSVGDLINRLHSQTLSSRTTPNSQH